MHRATDFTSLQLDPLSREASLLGLGLQPAVLVLLNNFLAIGEPACQGSVGFAVGPLGFEDFLSLLVPIDALAFALTIFEVQFQLLLTVGVPGFCHAVLLTVGVMLFGAGLFPCLVVRHPFA